MSLLLELEGILGFTLLHHDICFIDFLFFHAALAHVLIGFTLCRILNNTFPPILKKVRMLSGGEMNYTADPKWNGPCFHLDPLSLNSSRFFNLSLIWGEEAHSWWEALTTEEKMRRSEWGVWRQRDINGCLEGIQKTVNASLCSPPSWFPARGIFLEIVAVYFRFMLIWTISARVWLIRTKSGPGSYCFWWKSLIQTAFPSKKKQC